MEDLFYDIRIQHKPIESVNIPNVDILMDQLCRLRSKGQPQHHAYVV